MKSLSLIGFMGCGKSSVANYLKEQTGKKLVDLDDEIVKETGMPIAEYFERYGEEAFRNLEHEMLERYASMPDLILSPGGGAVLREDNRRVLEEKTCPVVLTASAPEILRRVNQDQTVRPVLEARKEGQSKLERIEELLCARHPAYMDVKTDLVIDTTDHSIAEVGAVILQAWTAGKDEDEMELLKTVHVELGARSYDIKIGSGTLKSAGREVSRFVKGRQAAVITDSNVGPLYADTVKTSLEAEGFSVRVVTIPAGESSKSWENAERILTILLEEKFHRDACVVALGGGVVGDLAGFVASVYQRGIAFIQIPTSLLAQVDSSVGGKVAVNHALGKNMIGSFYQPKLVLMDMDVLQTLEQRHWQNGLAEVVKYGVIYDQDFFCFLSEHAEALLERSREESAEMIACCCRIKAEVVAADETEKGLRAILNYGHTIAHGLELAGHFTGYLHGEAVAIGMVLAARLAAGMNLCGKDVEDAVGTLLRRLRLPDRIQAKLSLEDILEGIVLDKKVEDGQLVFVLPEAVGSVKIVKGVAKDQVVQLLQEELSRQE